MEEFTRCSVCARTPLVGERVTILRDASREAPVCDLCIAKPRSGALGEAVRRERVKTAAGNETVRRPTPRPRRPRRIAVA